MSTYPNGFPTYADDMGRRVEATHFCIHLRHDPHRCVTVDRNAPDARLTGVGHLIAPGVPDTAGHACFEDRVRTYGKALHTWRYDRDGFPTGFRS
ncbi:hypothetical protein SUDANB15_00955 [Streptomyces sp. enrichment culture]|uniref:DUF1264 domain-containing protein n=1 Tax=Streptomyces sp. enrichment culture TaxID=1795815 RepID=UPI003F542E38